MASANRHRRVRSQLPTCYYEGFLEKKTIKDKVSVKGLYMRMWLYIIYTYTPVKPKNYEKQPDIFILVGAEHYSSFM